MLNDIDTQTTAWIGDGVVIQTGPVSVIALADQSIHAFSFGGAVTGSFSASGSFTDNEVHSTVSAGIDGADISMSDALTVRASDASRIAGLAGNVGLSILGSSIGASAATNTIGRTIGASITGAATSVGADTVTVEALSAPAIAAVAAGFGGTFSGLAANGSVVLNTISDQVRSRIGSQPQVVAGTSLMVKALELHLPNEFGSAFGLGDEFALNALGDPSILAAAGSIGVASGISLGAAFSDNVVATTVEALLEGDADAGASLTVSADSEASIIAFAVSGAGGASSAVGGSVILNDVATVVDAAVTGDVTVSGAGSFHVTADNSAVIQGYAGGLVLSGGAGVGAAVITNDISTQTTARVEGEAAVTAADALVSATAEQAILALTLGGTSGSALALEGSVSTNEITSTVEATVLDGSFQVGSFTLEALDDSVIEALAGAVAFASGLGSFGAAVTLNDLSRTVRASLQETGTATDIVTGTFSLTATSRPGVAAAAVGATGGVGLAAATGSAVDNKVADTLEAGVSSGVEVEASGDVLISAREEHSDQGFVNRFGLGQELTIPGAGTDITGLNDLTILGVAGSIGFASGTGLGAAVSNNDIDTTVFATVDTADILSTGGSVTVEGFTDASVVGFAAGQLTALGLASASGSVVVNHVDTVTEAHVVGSDVDASENVAVTAQGDTDTYAFAGNLTIGRVAVGAAYAENAVATETRAYIQGGTAVSQTADVRVEAQAVQEMVLLSFGGAGGTQLVTSAASVSDNSTASVVSAYLSGADVTAAGNVKVKALDDSVIEVLSGGYGLAAVAGVASGAALTANLLDTTVEAYISGGTVSAGGEVDVRAETRPALVGAALGEAAGLAASAASIVDNSIRNDALAYIDGGANVTAQAAVLVRAMEESSDNTFSDGLGLDQLTTIGGHGVADILSVAGAMSLSRSLGVASLIGKGVAVEQILAQLGLVREDLFVAALESAGRTVWEGIREVVLASIDSLTNNLFEACEDHTDPAVLERIRERHSDPPPQTRIRVFEDGLAIDTVTATPLTDLNRTVTVSGTFTAGASLDTATLELAWGDGTTSEATIDPVARTFTATHEYADDEDAYEINAILKDDALAIDSVTGTPLTEENRSVTVSGNLSALGILDDSTVDIDWGDGTISEATIDPVARTFTATHDYPADGEPYTFEATLNNDGRVETVKATITVSDAEPMVQSVVATPSGNDDGIITLAGTFSDVTSFADPTIEIEWGDGTITEATLDLVAGTFTATHQYTDNADHHTPDLTLSDGGAAFDLDAYRNDVIEHCIVNSLSETGKFVSEQLTAALLAAPDAFFDLVATVIQEFPEIPLDAPDSLEDFLLNCPDLPGTHDPLVECLIVPLAQYVPWGEILDALGVAVDELIASVPELLDAAGAGIQEIAEAFVSDWITMLEVVGASTSAKAAILADVGSTIEAYVDGATVHSDGSTVTIQAGTQASILSAAAGVSAFTSFVLPNSEASFSHNKVATKVKAYVDGAADVESNGDLLIDAANTAEIAAFSGQPRPGAEYLRRRCGGLEHHHHGYAGRHRRRLGRRHRWRPGRPRHRQWIDPGHHGGGQPLRDGERPGRLLQLEHRQARDHRAHPQRHGLGRLDRRPGHRHHRDPGALRCRGSRLAQRHRRRDRLHRGRFGDRGVHRRRHCQLAGRGERGGDGPTTTWISHWQPGRSESGPSRRREPTATATSRSSSNPMSPTARWSPPATWSSRPSRPPRTGPRLETSAWAAASPSALRSRSRTWPTPCGPTWTVRPRSRPPRGT